MQKLTCTGRAKAGHRSAESGNVLFLILIAVALFAALSYAVTQSSRSGGGDVSSEKSLVSSSELTQYPAGVRTSILHMIVSNSLTVDELEFNPPSDFGSGKIIDDVIALGVNNVSVKQSVFHPNGGAATYQQASAELMAGGAAGTWHFNQNGAIPGIGSSKNDMVAYLVGVNKAVCQQVDTQLGISSVPVADLVAVSGVDQLKSGTGNDDVPVIAPDPTTLANTALPATIMGQPFACVSNGASPAVYTYYHVLIEQ